MTQDDRLIDLEMKIAHKEHLLDELNQTVYRQEKKIEELDMLLHALAKRFKELSDTSQDRAAANEKPPHY